MPTPFDDFTSRAHAYDANCSAEARANRSRLQGVMQAVGFDIYEPEWWHFDYRDWQHYAVLDIPFEGI